MSLGTRCCFYTGAHERFSKEQTIFPRVLASQPPTAAPPGANKFGEKKGNGLSSSSARPGRQAAHGTDEQKSNAGKEKQVRRQ